MQPSYHGIKNYYRTKVSQIDIIKDAQTGCLLDFAFHFENNFRHSTPWNIRICGAQPGVGVTEQYALTAPIVGFDCHYSETKNTFTNLTIQMNDCPIHQHLLVNKLVEANSPIFLRRIDPSFTSDVYSVASDSTYMLNEPYFYDQYTNDKEHFAEYITYDITWRIELHNQNSRVPNHIFIDSSDADFTYLVIDPTLARRPSHSYVRVVANLSGYFEVEQIIEVIIYDFDDTIGRGNCMHVSEVNWLPIFPPTGTFVTESDAAIQQKASDSFY